MKSICHFAFRWFPGALTSPHLRAQSRKSPSAANRLPPFVLMSGDPKWVAPYLPSSIGLSDQGPSCRIYQPSISQLLMQNGFHTLLFFFHNSINYQVFTLSLGILRANSNSLQTNSIESVLSERKQQTFKNRKREKIVHHFPYILLK